MLDHEYREKRAKSEKRDWILTCLAGVPALGLVALIVAAWKYIGHDPTVVIGLMIPAALVAFILGLAAWSGRPSAVKEAWRSIIESAIFWP